MPSFLYMGSWRQRSDLRSYTYNTMYFLLTLQPLRLFFPQGTALFTSCIHVYICLFTHVCKCEFQDTCLSIHSIKFLKIYSLKILRVCVYILILFTPSYPFISLLSHTILCKYIDSNSCLCMCVCAHACSLALVHMWRSESSSQDLALSSLHASPRSQTQVDFLS